MNGQKWRVCKFHFGILHFYGNKKLKKYQNLKNRPVLVSNVGKYNFVSYRQRGMLIGTIVFSSLQHSELEQKYANAKNRISAKLITKQTKSRVL